MALPATVPAPSPVNLVWKKSPIPPEYINSAAISADGKVVVAGTFCHQYDPKNPNPGSCSESAQFGTFYWNAQGNPLWQPDIFTGWQGVYWVAVSRDGSTIASGGWYSGPPSRNGFVAAYNVASKTRTLFNNTLPARTNMVALSDNGVYLVAANDSLYLYMSTGSGWGPPQVLPADPNDYYVAAVISGDGSWIVACTAASKIVLVRNSSGFFGQPMTLKIPNVTIHNVAIASGGSAFAAVGTNVDPNTTTNSGYVYCFSTQNAASPLQPLWSATLPNCKNCRAVALRDDGAFLSAVGSLTNPSEEYSGGVSVFKNVGGTGAVMWSAQTYRDPNSTSMDALGNYVTVADGYPDASPGHPSPGYFYLYDAYDGNPIWHYKTDNMAWPCSIAAKANAIVGGSDNGYVYAFLIDRPPAPRQS